LYDLTYSQKASDGKGRKDMGRTGTTGGSEQLLEKETKQNKKTQIIPKLNKIYKIQNQRDFDPVLRWIANFRLISAPASSQGEGVVELFPEKF